MLILVKAWPGIRFNEHMEGDGETVFRHACKLGLEGIVSKREDLPYL
jgi:bifunctional non-homologous end joining protein LigD